MRLVDALRILRQPMPDAAPFEIQIACGFTPLHLETFLGAHVQLLLPENNRVVTRTGLFGDLAGNLRRLEQSAAAAAALLLEWTDFDPRLGLRNPGGWGPEAVDDILAHAQAKAAEYADILSRLPGAMRLVVSMPTLPLPPVDTLPGWQSGYFELSLRAATAAMAAGLARRPGTRILNAQRLDQASPPAARLDARSEILGGFPYSASHAVALASQMARLLVKPAPLKGVITDLDDTLWNGIVGEVGVENVHWDLDHKSVIHGLYQQVLKSLAAQGTLVAVASKNDPKVVERAFDRADLLLPKDRVFPVEAHWGPKSHSVTRILKQWNISADAVVFVDDNPAELGEVKQAHPGIQTFLFPKNNPQQAVELLETLRDLFGKETVSEEDRYRLNSLRQASAMPAAQDGSAPLPETFLENANAEMTFGYAKDVSDARPFELLNKTNQFNLNGRRMTEAGWRQRLEDPAGILQVVSYTDKFGPLGRIGVLLGRQDGDTIYVDSWVLSCRAFSRRIEYQCLRQLFEVYGAEQVVLDYARTEKNGPTLEFLESLLGRAPGAAVAITKAEFERRSPALYHRVTSDAALACARGSVTE